MQHELLIAILAGLGGMLGWGFADFFAKKTIDKIGDTVTLFWGQLIGIIPLLVLFLFNPEVSTLKSLNVYYLVLLGVWSGLSYIPAYVAFGKGKVSLLSPIFATNAVIVAILSAVFFSELIPLSRWIIFLIVFIGVFLINTDPRDMVSLISGKRERIGEKVLGIKEILLATCLYSLWFITLDRFIGNKNWIPILLGIRIFSTLSLFAYNKIKDKSFFFPDKKLWIPLIMIGFFDVMAFAFISYGFSRTSYVSVVAILGGTFCLPTIILARIFLKEKVTPVQTIGSLVIVLGVVLLFLV